MQLTRGASTFAAERQEILREVESKTLISLFAETSTRLAAAPIFRWRQADQWKTLTWSEYRRQVFAVATSLGRLGFRRGEFAVVMSRNRPEAVIADFAILHAGGIPVHLYNSMPPEQVEYIVNHCDARFAFIEDQGYLEKFDAIHDRSRQLRQAAVFETVGGQRRIATHEWSHLVSEAAEGPPTASAFVSPSDICTVIYTSGTTGPPKGVIDTHEAVLYMLAARFRVVRALPSDKTISYLPIAHASARAAEVWGPVMVGGTIHFCPDSSQLVDYLLQVRPNSFTGVPRVWEKLRSTLVQHMNQVPGDVMHSMQRAIYIGYRASIIKSKGEPLPESLATDHAETAPVRRALRAVVGLDQCTRAATGAAPTDPGLIEYFQALDVPIAEVWGMTELACAATSVKLSEARIGMVGKALPGVELAIAKDGEILVRGPLVMQGYYRDPQSTAEVLTPDGWLSTGDIGELDADGYLRIVDRKKELIITAGGKNISPASIEALLKLEPLIGQACVIGDRRKYITALVVLDAVAARAWAGVNAADHLNLADLARHSQLLALIDRAVEAANARLARVEQVKRVTVLPVEWTAEAGELTPTLKLRRRVIEQRYAAEIERMYRETAPDARLAAAT